MSWSTRAARLREFTGAPRLNPITQALNASMKAVFDGRRLADDDRRTPPTRTLAPEHPRKVAVHSYSLPPRIVPILDQVLRQLGR